MRLIPFMLVAFLLAPLARAEDADAIRELGIAALKDSQTNPRAIVGAARHFVKAAELYNAAGNEEQNVEMNSFLYWCKKKMTMEDIDAFIKGGEAAVSTKLAAVEKSAPKVEDAQKWFDRADQFAKKNPTEHLLIAIRFYEIADRFKGTDTGLQAMDRSLKEQLLDKSSAVKTVAPLSPARPDVTPANTLEKRPVPAPAELTKSEKTIKELFKADYAKTDAASRQALIAKLLQQAEENKADPAAEYVLLEEARDLAVIVGDGAQAVAAQKRLTESFKIDRAAMLLELKKLESSAKTADPAAALAMVLMQGSEEALAAGDYDQAVRYNSRAEDLQIYIKVVDLKTRMKAEIARAQTLKRESVTALAAQKTLETKPDDPDANLIFGKFVLMLGDVEKSMPMLAKGKDPVLSGLAKLELTPPTVAADQAMLADGWFDRAEKESALIKSRMMERAALWYSTALPGLTGLTKMKVDTRIKTLLVTESKTTAPAPQAAASKTPLTISNLVTAELLPRMTGMKTAPADEGLELKNNGKLEYQEVAFRPPFTYTVEFKTDSQIRFYVGNRGSIILGWEKNPTELRVEDPIQTGTIAIKGMGAVTPNVWHTLKWTILKDKLTVMLDNKEIFTKSSDYEHLEARVAVGPSHGSTIAIKSVKVETAPLAPVKPATIPIASAAIVGQTEIFASGNNGITITVRGTEILKANRDKPNSAKVILRPGDSIAVKLPDRYDINSLWMICVSLNGEFLFETSESWTSYIPEDTTKWWRHDSPETKKKPAKFTTDKQEYVDQVKKAAAATPHDRKSQPIRSELNDGTKNSYLFYVVTVEDLQPKQPVKMRP